MVRARIRLADLIFTSELTQKIFKECVLELAKLNFNLQRASVEYGYEGELDSWAIQFNFQDDKKVHHVRYAIARYAIETNHDEFYVDYFVNGVRRILNNAVLF